MNIVDTKTALPHVIAREITRREAEELLYEALDLMGLLQAGVPVTAGWITVRDSLREEASILFEQNDRILTKEKEE